VDLPALLELYQRVRDGGRVPADRAHPLVEVLRLAGIVRVDDGLLQVRNRIYARVFDRRWVTQHMPDAELRRQRAAYLRGLLRTAAVSTVILAVVAGLAISERTQAHRAAERERAGRRLLYAAQM